MSFERYLKGEIAKALLDLHTAQLCRVLSYDSTSRTCDLQPLFQAVRPDGTTVTPPPVVSAPVLKHRFRVDGFPETHEYMAVYEPGDVVLTVAMERAIDHALSGEPADPRFDRRHHLTDIVVVGVIA